MLVGNKNLAGKKKKNKSYAPKTIVSRLGLKETPVAPGEEQPVSPMPTDGGQNQDAHGFGKEHRNSMASLLSKNNISAQDQQSCSSPLMNKDTMKETRDLYRTQDTTEIGKANTSNIHKLKTSLLLPDNRDFKVVISMPRIEYRIDCDHFAFVKTLSMTNLNEYRSAFFQSWHLIAIQQLMSYDKFKQQLLDVAYRIDNGLAQQAQSKKQNGKQLEPMTIESRNNRLSRKKIKKQRSLARRSHSCIPGQCSHERVRSRDCIDLEASRQRAEQAWRGEPERQS